MKKLVLSLLAAASATVVATAVQAAEYVSGSAGYYDVLDDENAATFGLEYRFDPIGYNLHPIIGGFVTTDSSAYGYAGLNWEVPLISNQLYLIPNFAAGLYSEGDGKDLGGAVEFRSGIEVAYQMQNFHRIGVAFNHISNASIYDKNPGVETVLVNYSIPTGDLLGR